jgi:two-component system chemotaxis sensor kinase CheA
MAASTRRNPLDESLAANERGNHAFSESVRAQSHRNQNLGRRQFQQGAKLAPHSAWELPAGTILNISCSMAPYSTAVSDEHLTKMTNELALTAMISNEPECRIGDEDLPFVKEFIAEAMGHIEAAEASILTLEKEPRDKEAIDAIFRSFHTIKGSAGFLHLQQFGELAHSAESMLNQIRHGDGQWADSTIDLVLDSIDLMKTMIVALDESARLDMPLARPERLPALLQRLRAWAPGQAKSASASTQIEEIPGRSAQCAESAQGQPIRSKTTLSERTVKVSTDRLDELINMIGELAIAQSMASQDLTSEMAADVKKARNIAHVGKIVGELQELSMSMRMVPIHGVFQKMARLVRDLAQKVGKEIEFSAIGGETEIDRNLVEALSDPLVHMVRNAVDHGLETPDVRARAGKPRCGRLELKAYHRGGYIIVEVSDDGRGLNKQRILQKAILADIVRDGQELSDQDIFHLIFHAGLSTAEQVTDVSGRGVGMDVVRKNVEALRGRIDIASVEGKGSTFSVRLPLTLAVIDGLVVKVGPERYIIPITGIEQSLRPTADQLLEVQGRGEMCLIRDGVLPLFRLHRLFDAAPQFHDPTEAIVVIVQDGDHRCCLLVDELLGQQQVVIKSLGESLPMIPGISGGAILGDGNVSLILDVPGLIGLAKTA